MVKHPKYQAMDRARQEMIPRAFEMLVSTDYKMARVEPSPPSEPVAGPVPRPVFNVINEKTGEIVAVFSPNGYSECMNDDFRGFFKKITRKVEKAAKQALINYELSEKNTLEGLIPARE
ncbi:MAG: hypothetical protein ACTSUE_14890 [Promethearchaeota archaeon]